MMKTANHSVCLPGEAWGMDPGLTLWRLVKLTLIGAVVIIKTAAKKKAMKIYS